MNEEKAKIQKHLSPRRAVQTKRDTVVSVSALFDASCRLAAHPAPPCAPDGDHSKWENKRRKRKTRRARPFRRLSENKRNVLPLRLPPPFHRQTLEPLFSYFRIFFICRYARVSYFIFIFTFISISSARPYFRNLFLYRILYTYRCLGLEVRLHTPK